MSEQQSLASTSRPGSPIAPLPELSSVKPYRFAWDTASRRPGPASVSGQSEVRGDYFAYRPSLGNFNFSSASLALGSIPPDWSSSKYGFNAISTLVNSPHKKSAPPKAHAPVPPVVPSQLPRVRRKDFDIYLKSVGPEWEQFENIVKASQEDQNEAFASQLAELEHDHPSTPRNGRGSTPTSLETVPPIFFDADFDLSDQKTFHTVTDQEGADGSQDPAHSLPLLERLSHHADTIELHLIREISLRSSSFFAALTNLHELQSESSQCLERVRTLRGMLREVDDNNAKKGLELVRLERKIGNMNSVKDGVKTMHNVGEMLHLASNLAQGGEWDAALGLIEDIRCLWDGESAHKERKQEPVNPNRKNSGRASKRSSLLPSVEPIIEEGFTEEPTSSSPSIPLSMLKAFSQLPEHLQSLTLDISASLTSELVTTLRTDLLSQLDSPPPKNSELPPDPSSVQDDERLIALRDRLRPLARGLIRTNNFKDAVAKWTEAARTEIGECVKRILPFSEDFVTNDGNSPAQEKDERRDVLRDELRNMPYDKFMSLLCTLYNTLLRSIQEIQRQNTVLYDVVQLLELPANVFDTSVLQSDLSDLLSSVAERSHLIASKVLGKRADQHASLSLESFFSVFNETWSFVVNSETICRRMIVSLRGTIVSQAKNFLQTMHQSRISQSAKFVEEEQWAAVEVPSRAQVLTKTIVDAAVRDSPDLLVSETEPHHSNGSSSTPPSSSKHLYIEERKYFAVSATLKMLEALVDYLRVITNLSLLTTDAMSRVIEFLKAFNSRTCQVVLGAGAMRSAGLKNITAKHLALASQSLSIVVALIPYVRECFRRHLNPKQAVMLVEFDKLKRDYQEHQQEIHAKLVAIMGDRLSAHCKSLAAVDWSLSRDSVNDYMTVLVKETVTLHKVLSRYLQESVLEYIMSQVFAAMNHRLSEEYSKIELPSQEAKERMLRDTRYLHQQFSGLKHVNAPTGMLETVVSEKQIPLQPGEQLARVRSRSPGPISPTPETPLAQVPNPPSTAGSTNERLRGIFKRSSTFLSGESKSASARPLPSPVAERPSLSIFPEKVMAQEPESRVNTPPPIPDKLNLSNGLTSSTASPTLSAPRSPFERPRSPRVLEKALPIPVPTLDSNGNISDGPELSSSSPSYHKESVEPSQEADTSLNSNGPGNS